LWLQKKVGQQIFFYPSLAVFESGMDKNQDPISGINILDPQHWIPGKHRLRNPQGCLPVVHGGELPIVTIHGAAAPGGLGEGGGEAEPGVLGPLTAGTGAAAVAVAPAQPAVRRR
jgi:hypothetical protein